MPQVTLSVPHEKLPLLKDVLYSIGIDRGQIRSNSKAVISHLSTVKKNAGSLYQKYFGWEYNMNELEFE